MGDRLVNACSPIAGCSEGTPSTANPYVLPGSVIYQLPFDSGIDITFWLHLARKKHAVSLIAKTSASAQRFPAQMNRLRAG
jgi:hypothetical protein